MGSKVFSSSIPELWKGRTQWTGFTAGCTWRCFQDTTDRKTVQARPQSHSMYPCLPAASSPPSHLSPWTSDGHAFILQVERRGDHIYEWGSRPFPSQGAEAFVSRRRFKQALLLDKVPLTPVVFKFLFLNTEVIWNSST